MSKRQWPGGQQRERSRDLAVLVLCDDSSQKTAFYMHRCYSSSLCGALSGGHGVGNIYGEVMDW